MKRVLSTVVSALVALAFAGLVSAAEPYGTDTRSPTTESEPGMTGDTTEKPVTKTKKKWRKTRKTKKEMKDTEMGTGAGTGAEMDTEMDLRRDTGGVGAGTGRGSSSTTGPGSRGTVSDPRGSGESGTEK